MPQKAMLLERNLFFLASMLRKLKNVGDSLYLTDVLLVRSHVGGWNLTLMFTLACHVFLLSSLWTKRVDEEIHKPIINRPTCHAPNIILMSVL